MAVDKSDARVRKMFGEIAPGYDRMNHLLSMNVDRYWRWRTVRKLAPHRGARVLDLCTGTGDLAIAFAKSADGTCEVTAADFCREMLEIGEQKRMRRQLPNVAFVQADAQRLPFPDNQFDFVTVAFGLRNVADTDQGLREMARVTRPGGKVAVLEFSTPRRQPIKSIYGFYFKHILPRIGQWLARNDSDAYRYLPESVGDFPSYDALTQRMKQAGLETAEFHPLTFGVATLYIGSKSGLSKDTSARSTTADTVQNHAGMTPAAPSSLADEAGPRQSPSESSRTLDKARLS